MKKCVYCGKPVSHSLYLIPGEKGFAYTCCSPECKDSTKDFFGYYNRYQSVFQIVLYLSIIIFAAAFFGLLPYYFLYIGVGLMEINCLIFPFLFLTNNEKLFIKRSKRFSRVLSIVLLALIIFLILKDYVFHF